MQRQGEIIETVILSLLVKCWIVSVVWVGIRRAESKAALFMGTTKLQQNACK